MIAADPSTPTHAQPDRKTAVARAVRRQCRSFTDPPSTTKATASPPPAGWVITPALTTEEWTDPSGRPNETTANPRSAAANRRTSSMVGLIVFPLSGR